MTCTWRIHGSKPYVARWSLVYNTSVFCFSHFHLEGVGGWSEPNEASFEKNCHILRRSLKWRKYYVGYIYLYDKHNIKKQMLKKEQKNNAAWITKSLLLNENIGTLLFENLQTKLTWNYAIHFILLTCIYVYLFIYLFIYLFFV